MACRPLLGHAACRVVWLDSGPTQHCQPGAAPWAATKAPLAYQHFAMCTHARRLRLSLGTAHRCSAPMLQCSDTFSNCVTCEGWGCTQCEDGYYGAYIGSAFDKCTPVSLSWEAHGEGKSCVSC